MLELALSGFGIRCVKDASKMRQRCAKDATKDAARDASNTEDAHFQAPPTRLLAHPLPVPNHITGINPSFLALHLHCTFEALL